MKYKGIWLTIVSLTLMGLMMTTAHAVTPQVDTDYFQTVGLKSDGTVVVTGKNDVSWTDIKQLDAGGGMKWG